MKIALAAIMIYKISKPHFQMFQDKDSKKLSNDHLQSHWTHF